MRSRVRRMVTGLVAAAMLAGGSAALPSPVLAAAPHGASVAHGAALIDCSGHRVIRPRNVILTCADANTILRHVRWDAWGGPRSTARATFAENTCTPNCAEGHFARYPVRVTALHRVGSGGASRYSKIVVRFPHAHPSWVKDRRAVFTLPSPTAG